MSDAKSDTPYWGRAYELQVYTTSDGSGSPGYTFTSDAWEPEALRMTFEVLQSALPEPWWFADISIYNLTDAAAQNVLTKAQWVILKAGYQSIGSDVIWSGAVMQVLYEREGVVDYKVTFHCLATDPKTLRSVNFKTNILANQAQIVSAMAAGIKGYQLTTPVPQDLGDNQYMRRRTLFGSIDKYYSQIATGNYMQWFKSPQGSSISKLTAVSDTPNIVYSPPLPPDWRGAAPTVTTSFTILGSPQQTDSGITFQVLLDPRLIVKVPPLLVRIDNSFIKQATLTFPQSPQQLSLDADNSYVVAEVRHSGDTRGNTWQTEVRGFARAYTQGALRGIFRTGQ